MDLVNIGTKSHMVLSGFILIPFILHVCFDFLKILSKNHRSISILLNKISGEVIKKDVFHILLIITILLYQNYSPT